jgi:hypothetical protein
MRPLLSSDVWLFGSAVAVAVAGMRGAEADPSEALPVSADRPA